MSWLLCAGSGSATTQQAGAQNVEDSKEDLPVREIGGRLVTSGETVVVEGDSDQPSRDSSVATKIETPLLDTPRSISIIDRGTLDDLAVVNITQAHDYTVGRTPQDERGPGFARGFPVDFYDVNSNAGAYRKAGCRATRISGTASQTCGGTIARSY